MPVHVVTGKLGAGKTLVSVSRIQKYLNENRKVATNLDLKLENLINPYAKKTCVYRLPDIPTVESFKAIGQGYEGKLQGDHKNGLVVLDECALWLNSRSWNDKERKKLIDYFVHLRKLRWDLLILIQDENALDKQFRDLYGEHTVFCSRTDRLSIPVIGWLYSTFIGDKMPLPKVHLGSVYYNSGTGMPSHVQTWMYKGTGLYDAYDTEQAFNTPDSPDGVYSYLPPYTIKGRYVSKGKLLKERLKNIGALPLFFAGLAAGVGVVQAMTPDGNSPDRGNWTCNKDWKALFGDCELSKQETIDAYHAYKKIKQGGEVVSVEDGSDAPLGAPAPDETQTEEPDIHITASVKFDSGQYEYYFKQGENNYQPFEHGYRVYDVGPCQATLIDMEDRRNRKSVYCK